MNTNKFSLRLLALTMVLALVFQLSGPSSAEGIVIDTSRNQQNMVVRGEFQHGTLGEVSILGDFNNDGIDDLLIGAPASNIGGREFAGAAYVILGGASRFSYNLAQTPAHLTIYGAEPGDVLGHSVATGDVNGDGIDDMIIGADLVNTGEGEDVGAVYIFLGRTDPNAFTYRTLQPANADVIILGEQNLGRFGRAVAAGDITGNGIEDIVVGAYYASPGGRTEAGAVYVIQGRDTFSAGSQTVINLMANPGAANLRIYGASGGSNDAASTLSSRERSIHPALEDVIDVTEQNLIRGDRLGRTIAVGDVNGDGSNDIIVGAYLASVGEQAEAGKTYVFYGNSQYQTPGNVIDLGNGGQANVTINGVASGDQAGFFVTSGNTTNDPYAEVVIGAYLADNQAGRVYVVNGRADMPTQINLSNQANVVIHGAAPGDRLGRSLALSDINGNGQDDLLLGASRATPFAGTENARVAAGMAYIIYTDQELPATIQLSQTDLNHIRILGAASGTFDGPNACVSSVEEGILQGNCPDEFGRAIAAGDFDGDGHNDIIVGALFSNNQSLMNAGAVYLFNTEALGRGPTLYLPLLYRETR